MQDISHHMSAGRDICRNLCIFSLCISVIYLSGAFGTLFAEIFFFLLLGNLYSFDNHFALFLIVIPKYILVMYLYDMHILVVPAQRSSIAV